MTRHVKKDRLRRGRGDDGAALVEFALVSILLFVLVFAIIHFGWLLSFKQDMTRAAAEGARAGAVAFPPSQALTNAEQATEEAVEGMGKSCTAEGMTCNVTLGACADGSGYTGDCVTVELLYDQAEYPLLGSAPFVSAFMPDQLRSVSVARVNR